MFPANLLHVLPPPSNQESVDMLARGAGVRVERIVSHGHCSPPGFWYEQAEREWVAVLTGAARLEFDDGQILALQSGDHVDIPAGRRHRVAWTDPDQPTVWLAVFYRDASSAHNDPNATLAVTDTSSAPSAPAP